MARTAAVRRCLPAEAPPDSRFARNPLRKKDFQRAPLFNAAPFSGPWPGVFLVLLVALAARPSLDGASLRTAAVRRWRPDCFGRAGATGLDPACCSANAAVPAPVPARRDSGGATTAASCPGVLGSVKVRGSAHTSSPHESYHHSPSAPAGPEAKNELQFRVCAMMRLGVRSGLGSPLGPRHKCRRRGRRSWYTSAHQPDPLAFLPAWGVPAGGGAAGMRSSVHRSRAAPGAPQGRRATALPLWT
mmetsp:Transcript_10022/g.23054  ORF Transcript_10022/g.23054 Transcript_10022/m.23054 type:complete len:245 (-) Transcript_10022:390-1124(-)